MKKIILMMIMVLAISCGFFKRAPDAIDNESVAPPNPVQSTEDDSYYFYEPSPDRDNSTAYDPSEDPRKPSDDPNNSGESTVVECQMVEETTEVTVYVTKPIYTGIFYTKTGSRTINIKNRTARGYNLGYVYHSDHIHITGARLSVSPGNLSFVKFAILKTEDDLPLMWFNNADEETVNPQFDGSIDLRPYVNEDMEITVNYIARGRAPMKETDIHGELDLQVYYNCKESNL